MRILLVADDLHKAESVVGLGDLAPNPDSIFKRSYVEINVRDTITAEVLPDSRILYLLNLNHTFIEIDELKEEITRCQLCYLNYKTNAIFMKVRKSL